MPATAPSPATTRGATTSCCSSPPTACARTRSSSYADQGVVPGFRDCCATARAASGNGLLTQAPPNTGAGWFTLATGAWPGVARLDEQHLPRQRPAVRQLARRALRRAGVLQAETLAQSAERGGKKVAQIEWAGGRSGAINGPTLDFRDFRSGRGVATNYISPTDLRGVHRGVRPAVRPPGRLRRPARRSRRRRRRRPPAGPTCRGRTARRRRCACASSTAAHRRQVRAQRLHLRQPQRRHARATTGCCSRRPRTATTRSATSREGEWADVKVTIARRRRASTARPAAFLVKVERLRRDLSQVRLFHTSVTRAIATLAEWPGEPGFTGDFEDFVAERFPSSQAGDFAVLEAGIVSEETYVEQGALLGDGLPPADQVRARHLPAGPGARRLPGHRRVPAPVPRARHPEAARTARRNPAYDDVEVNGTPDGRVKQREAFIRDAYKGADATMRLAQEHCATAT